MDDFIARIYAGEDPNSVFKEITEYLSSPEIDLTESEYNGAYGKAAEEWQPNEAAFSTVAKLHERGYRTIIVSGSAFEALALAAKKVNFEPYQIFSTTFSFGSDGKLKRIYPMLGENKSKKIKQLFGEQIEISATDDLKNDYYIIEGAQLAIIVSAKDPNVEQYTERTYVFDEKIRDNFSLILDYVDKFEYSYIRSKLTTEDEERSIVEYVAEMKKSLREERKTDFVKFLKLLNISLKDFNLFDRNEQMIAEYEIALRNHSEEEKRLLDGINSTLGQLPEFVNTEAFVKELEFDDN
jgi:phosphoserine phosphatase